MMFNVEEKNLLILFHTGFRRSTMEELKTAKARVVDHELDEIFQHILDKLSKLSDEEYAALDMSMEEEFAYDE